MMTTALVFIVLAVGTAVTGILFRAQDARDARPEPASWGSAIGATVLAVGSAGFRLAAPARDPDEVWWFGILTTTALLLILIVSLVTKTSSEDTKTAVASVVAVFALAGYGWLFNFMMHRAEANETVWGRYVYLYAGAEAIAFGAAGFFFGHQVARTQANDRGNNLAQAIMQARMTTATVQAATTDKDAQLALANACLDDLETKAKGF